MRILVFGFSRDKLGGIETFLLGMNEHMSSNTIFDYVVLQGLNPSQKCICENRILKRGGKVLYVPSYGRHPISYALQCWKLIKENKKQNCGKGVVYVNLFSMVHILPALLGKMTGCKVVIHSHNNDMPQQGKVYRWLHAFNRWLFSGMKCTRLTNSQASTVFMFGKKHLNDAHLIYTAIEPQKFKFNPVNRQKIRKELGLEGKTVIGFVGRLARQKNPLFALDVFKAYHIQNPCSMFLMVGEGELRTPLEQRIVSYGLKDSIILTGNRRDVQNLYQAMDVFFLPSLFEGSGIVLVEAQAAGLPCLTSADVVPRFIQLSTESVKFIALKDEIGTWVSTLQYLSKVDTDRLNKNQVVKLSGFNITNEAVNLQLMLSSNKG